MVTNNHGNFSSETWVTMETSVNESSASLGSLNTVTGQWFLDEFVSSSKLAAAQVRGEITWYFDHVVFWTLIFYV